MRIREIAAHEDVSAVVATTLSRGLSVMHGVPVQASSTTKRGCRWFEQRIFSVFIASGIADGPREYLIDQLRHTPARWRATAQWGLATVAGTHVGLRLSSRRAFFTYPEVPAVRHTIVVPGHQRIRVLDFARRRSWAFLKEGFSTESIRREIVARGSGVGPYPCVIEADVAHGWFAEPLLDGHTLPRCGSLRERRCYEARAVDALLRYHEAHGTNARTTDYVGALLSRIAQLAPSVERIPGAPSSLDLELLARALADRVGTWEVELARSHGDFQPGNVFVAPRQDHVWLIDWEMSDVRSRPYDALTYGLHARFPRGLAARAHAFIASGALGGAGRLIPASHSSLRARAVPLFLLEDLVWRLEQAAGGRYRRVPSAFSLLLVELGAFLRG